jgi:acyl-CoA dehydrogenase
VFENFPVRAAAWVMRVLCFPSGKKFRIPNDELGHRVARLMIEPSQTRDRVTSGVYFRRSEDDPVGRLEMALELAADGDALEGKIRAALKRGTVSGLTEEDRVKSAVTNGAISHDEAVLYRRYSQLRRACIMVDDFPRDVGRMENVAEIPRVKSLDLAQTRKTA